MNQPVNNEIELHLKDAKPDVCFENHHSATSNHSLRESGLELHQNADLGSGQVIYCLTSSFVTKMRTPILKTTREQGMRRFTKSMKRFP